MSRSNAVVPRTNYVCSIRQKRKICKQSSSSSRSLRWTYTNADTVRGYLHLGQEEEKGRLDLSNLRMVSEVMIAHRFTSSFEPGERENPMPPSRSLYLIPKLCVCFHLQTLGMHRSWLRFRLGVNMVGEPR